MNPTVDKAQNEEKPSSEISREIFRYEGLKNGPNLVFIGAMHGNEPSGLQALEKVSHTLAQHADSLKGNVYGFIGNLGALEKGQRYITEDLNRIWQKERVDKLMAGAPDSSHEATELVQLWTDLKGLMDTHSGPFTFIDLHTTSVNTVPFITMSDTIMNRQIAKRIPVPVVIGIEEYLDEPFLSFANELGCASFAFEAGQHTDPQSVENHEALIWMTLDICGILPKSVSNKFESSERLLQKNAGRNHNLYEVRMRQGLTEADKFEMNPGFENFEAITEGEKLATLNGETVISPQEGFIFMPLYQSQGSDAYFVINTINKLWMGVSYVFRTLKFFKILQLLPGVHKSDISKEALRVDPDVAKWYSKEILHLMGYRRKIQQSGKLVFLRRKYDMRGPRA